MHLDPIRREVSAKLDRKQRSALGQFMTPTRVADFMAGLFPATGHADVYETTGSGLALTYCIATREKMGLDTIKCQRAG